MKSPNLAQIFGIASILSLAACAPPAEEAVETSTQNLGETAQSLTFGADWSVQADGVVRAGTTVRVVYDSARMPVCRGEINGGLAWSVTGHYKIGGGPEKTFEAAGHRASGGAGPVAIDIPRTFADDLEIWFEIGNRWGCHDWDSAYGANYHFPIATPKGAPRWAGNVKAVSQRQTCGAGVCEGDWRELTSDGYDFGTWTRQRAAVTQLAFEVYEPGKTDWDNPDLWKQLDVQLHSRIGDAGPFTTRHVSIDRRLGNNTRYAFNTRDIDPFRMWNTPQTKADCPKFPMTHAAGYVHADVQFYLTIHGVELRPRSGGVFHGRYEEYGGPFAICATP